MGISVNGGAFVAVALNGAIPGNAQYYPALSFSGNSMSLEVSGAPIVGPCLPLDILLEVAALAKKYMVGSVSSMATQALKQRLLQAKRDSCGDTFERIMSASVTGDLGAVRMAALEC